MRSRLTRLALGLSLAAAAAVLAPSRAEAAPGWEFLNMDLDTIGRCLDRDVGTNRMQMWECHSGANQDWAIYDPGGTWVAISDPSNTWCVRSSGSQGAQVTAGSCGSYGTSVRWIPHWRGDGWYVFESVRVPGQCLDVRDFGQSRVVQLWSCTYAENQYWTDWFV